MNDKTQEFTAKLGMTLFGLVVIVVLHFVQPNTVAASLVFATIYYAIRLYHSCKV